MRAAIDRRCFVRTSGLLLGGAVAPSLLQSTSLAAAGSPSNRLRKAISWDMIQDRLSVEDKFRLAKDVGFEGVETSRQPLNKDAPDPKVLARASEKVGVPIHGVSNGGNVDMLGAIDEAAICGATTVLQVVRTDPNTSFMENYRRTQDAIRAVIPHAEKKRIQILIENVWATFLIEPLTMARYVDEFGSPYVKAYFDVGNCMRWGWPQHWIEVLGKRIGKIHVKEFSLKVAMKEGMIKAFDFPLGQGDIDWKRVREQLKKIEYYGWVTAEVRGGDRQHLADVSAQMDRILNPY